VSAIPAQLRRRVALRAGGRCEYCRVSQAGQEAEFHIDHIIPVSAGGPTTPDNLALACVGCSLRKGARRRAVDPVKMQTVRLFHPRRQRWSTHFRWDGIWLAGRTAVGRATVDALGMNRVVLLAIRLEEAERGRHPPAPPRTR
jgi:hypothetical protein